MIGPIPTVLPSIRRFLRSSLQRCDRNSFLLPSWLCPATCHIQALPAQPILIDPHETAWIVSNSGIPMLSLLITEMTTIVAPYGFFSMARTFFPSMRIHSPSRTWLGASRSWAQRGGYQFHNKLVWQSIVVLWILLTFFFSVGKVLLTWIASTTSMNIDISILCSYLHIVYLLGLHTSWCLYLDSMLVHWTLGTAMILNEVVLSWL